MGIIPRVTCLRFLWREAFLDDFVHTARPLSGCSPEHAGSARNSRHGKIKSTAASLPAPESKNITIGADLVTCPRCGALVERGIDCRETVACPGDPDQQLFAPFMSPYRVYDLSNCFDRDAIRAALEEKIRKCRDYRVTYPKGAALHAETWRRLINMRDRLNELDEQALPEKRGAR